MDPQQGKQGTHEQSRLNNKQARCQFDGVRFGGGNLAVYLLDFTPKTDLHTGQILLQIGSNRLNILF